MSHAAPAGAVAQVKSAKLVKLEMNNHLCYSI